MRILLLAGLALSATVVEAHAGRFNVLYQFQGGADGWYPHGSLIAVGDKFYGTTVYGGSSLNGTIFSITPSGKMETIYSFQVGNNAADPCSGLTRMGNVFYGMTEDGANSVGAIYGVSKTGVETLLYSFKILGSGDGAEPRAGLVNLKGVLYGTTPIGGANGGCSNYGCGTVISVTHAGTESVLYSFKADGSDGSSPQGNLINVGGTLYGTATSGGASGNGTVFSITPKGIFTVLYSFNGGTDGASPLGALTAVNGVLYGVTTSGGLSGNGTVFSVTLRRTEKVLHSFAGGADGSYPGTLILADGKLFGTTTNGGSSGNGTIYTVTFSGVEKVVHNFDYKHGSGPYDALLYDHGALYGTTAAGGTIGNYGEVFEFKP